jgi:hypothetical protein
MSFATPYLPFVVLLHILDPFESHFFLSLPLLLLIELDGILHFGLLFFTSQSLLVLKLFLDLGNSVIRYCHSLPCTCLGIPFNNGLLAEHLFSLLRCDLLLDVGVILPLYFLLPC